MEIPPLWVEDAFRVEQAQLPMSCLFSDFRMSLGVHAGATSTFDEDSPSKTQTSDQSAGLTLAGKQLLRAIPQALALLRKTCRTQIQWMGNLSAASVSRGAPGLDQNARWPPARR
jgi:hypothetical protein